MPTKIAFAIYHYPGPRLRDQNVARCKVMIPDIMVLSDVARLGSWKNHILANRAIIEAAKLNPEITHGVVIPDDMELCNNFLPNVYAAVTARPDKPIVLFSMRRSVDKAVAQNCRWATSRDAGGGSTVMPINWFQEFDTWETAHIQLEYPYEDRRLAAWIIWVKQAVFYVTCPTLLQHIGQNESTLGHSNYTRVSTNYKKDLGILQWGTDKPPYVMDTNIGAWIKTVEANLIRSVT